MVVHTKRNAVLIQFWAILQPLHYLRPQHFANNSAPWKGTDLTLFLKTSREPVAKLSRIGWLVACFGGSPSLKESHGVGLGLSARHSVRHVYFLCSHIACSACCNVSNVCFCLQRLCRLILKTNSYSNSAFWPTVFTFRVFLTTNSHFSLTRQFTHLSKFINISSDSIPPNTEFKFIPLLHTQTVYCPSSDVRLSPTLHIFSYLHFTRRREGKT